MATPSITQKINFTKTPMSQEEQNYRKFQTPDDWERRAELMRQGIANAKREDEKKRALTAKNAWWLKRRTITETYGV